MTAYTILGTNARTIGVVRQASSAEEAIEKALAGKIMMSRGVTIGEGEELSARVYVPGTDRR